MNKPSVTHWRTGKELLRYLKHTRFATLRLTKCSDEELYLRVFSDADFAQQTDRKSITGFVYLLGPNLIDWKSRKQTLVTTSTTEAELVAMSDATDDLEWKLALRQEMSGRSGPAMLLSDCLSAIKKLKRGEAGGRTKHLDIRAKAVADRMKRELVSLSYVPTEDNVADMLTKRLGFQKVKHLCDLIGLALVVNDEPSQAG